MAVRLAVRDRYLVPMGDRYLVPIRSDPVTVHLAVRPRYFDPSGRSFGPDSSKRVENLAFFSKIGEENGNVTLLMSHKSAVVKILILAEMVEFWCRKWSKLR